MASNWDDEYVLDAEAQGVWDDMTERARNMPPYVPPPVPQPALPPPIPIMELPFGTEEATFFERIEDGQLLVDFRGGAGCDKFESTFKRYYLKPNVDQMVFHPVCRGPMLDKTLYRAKILPNPQPTDAGRRRRKTKRRGRKTKTRKSKSGKRIRK